jgi:hypothetical protein
MNKAAKLARSAKSAAEVRAYQTDPDVVALRVERTRAWVDRLVWAGIIAGLLFTMANVQHFAARGAKPPWEHGGSVEWVIAWLLDPMVSLILIGVLMGEQVINRYQLTAGAWVRRTKWVALTCTYAMNTWSAWAAADAALILLHSVPPVIVVCAAEAITTLRHQISEAVTVAYRIAAERNVAIEKVRAGAADGRSVREGTTPEAVPAPTVQLDELAHRSAETGRTDGQRPNRTETRTGSRDADRTVKPTRTAPTTQTRTGAPRRPVDREAIVAELAAEFREAVAAGTKWVPDYAALMERTGFKRSWCEKVARDARQRILAAEEAQDDRTAEDTADGTDSGGLPAHARTDDDDPDRTPAAEPERSADESDRTDGVVGESTESPYGDRDRTDGELVGAGERS